MVVLHGRFDQFAVPNGTNGRSLLVFVHMRKFLFRVNAIFRLNAI